MVTRMAPSMLEESDLSHYEMMRLIAAKLLEWSPAVFVGYNSLRFDERLLRQAFYQILLPIYATNTNGNYRADIMVMAQAVAAYAPNAITVPQGARDRQVFQLGALARANGISLPEGKAHDALNDTTATLELARVVRNASYPGTIHPPPSHQGRSRCGFCRR